MIIFTSLVIPKYFPLQAWIFACGTLKNIWRWYAIDIRLFSWLIVAIKGVLTYIKKKHICSTRFLSFWVMVRVQLRGIFEVFWIFRKKVIAWAFLVLPLNKGLQGKAILVLLQLFTLIKYLTAQVHRGTMLLTQLTFPLITSYLENICWDFRC